MKPNLIYGHPHDFKSNFAKFSKEMFGLIGCDFFRYTSDSWTAKYFVPEKTFHKLKSEKTTIKILNESKFNLFLNYLKENNYSFNEEKSQFCCSDLEKKTKTIKFSFESFFGNQIFLAISPRNNFELLRVGAYFDKFERQEELLQKALVQEDIYLRNESEYAEDFHCSSSFRIFNSLKEANETIDKEIFEYLKETIKRDNFDGAFIMGNEEKYRLPLTLPSKILKKDYNSLGNICAIGMELPRVLTTHEDGITIATNDTTNKLPLKEYFNSKEGILWDMRLSHVGGSNYYGHYLGVCQSCEESKLFDFKQKIIDEVKNFESLDLNGEIAKKIGYKIDLNKLKLKILDRETNF